MPRIQLEDLLSPGFLDSLQALRFTARRVPGGGRYAEQRSRDLGSGIEFRDFRPYVPGDDLRSIDWNIYQRLGRVFVRLFEEMEDLPIYLMPDVSQSMFFETPPRGLAGLRCALALAAVGLNQHDTVGLFPFADDLRMQNPPRSGANQVIRLARLMTRIDHGGVTDLGTSLKKLAALRLRPGLLVILSDFFDPEGLGRVARALSRVRHKVLLVQLVRPSDDTPELQGDLLLRDCETGHTEEVSITPAVLQRYREAHASFLQELIDLARRRRAGLLRVNAEQDVVPQLAGLFESGRYEV